MRTYEVQLELISRTVKVTARSRADAFRQAINASVVCRDVTDKPGAGRDRMKVLPVPAVNLEDQVSAVLGFKR